MKINNTFRLLVLLVIVWPMACAPKKEAPSSTSESDSMNFITKTPFGTADGKDVYLYTLRNKNGMELSVMNYGGIVTSLKTPDKAGVLGDVVLGYDSLAAYIRANPYFGSIVGRYGNRIAKGKFSLDGTAYTLATNNGENHLHGGVKGFDKVWWKIEESGTADEPALQLTYRSTDGEEGYPGNLDVIVRYTLTNNNEWIIRYSAVTDKKTVVNLTNHAYFNLAADPGKDILAHELSLNADKFLPVDKGLIPGGELKPVAGTPFDFTKATAIGSRINDKDTQIELGKGYDHCWALNGGGETLTEPRSAATVYDPSSGRYMEVLTTEPGIQFYTGNFLEGKNIGKGGIPLQYRHGFCLETEHFPDSPNKPSFPSVILEPGTTYQTTTVYKFSVK